jgi:hypothetical protein
MLGAVMLASAAVSAGCCLAPRVDASGSARTLAGAMVATMAAVALDAAPMVQEAGALLVLALVALLRLPPERGRAGEWHRTAGAVLMAIAVLLHEHDATMSHAMAVTPGTGGQHAVLVLLVRTATAAYLCAMSISLILLRHRPITDLNRGEHLAMAASLSTMVFFMS